MNLPELELELIDLLQAQGWPVAEMHLIGLLGRGSRATVFSVMIDGAYYVLKVYDSAASLQAELVKLKRISRDRLVFSWQERAGHSSLNLAIIEVPEGQELNSSLLTPAVMSRLAERLAELHRIRYRQPVAVTALRERFDRYLEPFLAHIKLMGLDLTTYQSIIATLSRLLSKQPGLFRVNKVRIHGDLWWPNVIVAQEDVYIVDWESLRRGDAAEDLAKLRLIVYWPRQEADPVSFWRDPEDSPKLAQLMKTVVAKHESVTGDHQIAERLRFYLPFLAMSELADRYLTGRTATIAQQAKNLLLADEFRALVRDPLSPAPDLRQHGYFESLNSSSVSREEQR